MWTFFQIPYMRAMLAHLAVAAAATSAMLCTSIEGMLTILENLTWVLEGVPARPTPKATEEVFRKGTQALPWREESET